MNNTFDYEFMTGFMNHFFTLMNGRYCLYDPNHNIVCSCGESSKFCDMVTSGKNNHFLCAEDDIKHFQRLSANKNLRSPYIYRCYCGVINILYPIYVDDNICGYILFGQFLDNSNIEQQWLLAKEGLGFCSKDTLNSLRSAFYELPHHPSNNILSICKILEACSSYIEAKGITGQAYQSDEEQLLAIIHKKFAEPITLDSIANEMNISKTKLCGIASKQGTTILSMINEYRIRIAKDLLANSNRSITNISQTVGITDYNYFSRLFKKMVGLTPSEYRDGSKKSRHNGSQSHNAADT